MKTHAVMVILLGAIALLVAALAPPGRAAAQPQPTMVLSPSSGACDAPVEVRGVGLEQLQVPEPGPGPALYLLRPGTGDVNVEILNGVAIYDDGTFTGSVPLWKHGCEAAALDSQAEHPSGYLSFALSGGGPTVQPGERIPNIIAVARYAYTTTVRPPQPTMVLSPSSGPCDALLEVAGGGFPASTGLVLYLVQPGSGDVNASALNGAEAGPDGTFSQWVGLQHGGCDAAALDSQAERPAGHLLIAAVSGRGAAVGPGARIDGIIAVAQYTYTTTAPHVSTETLNILPAGGPCDGTVEVTGRGFEPGTEVVLKLAGPGDVTLGTLTSALPDADGRFVAHLALGEEGCRAAQGDVIAGNPARPQLTIWAERAVAPSTPVPLPGYPTPMPVRIDTFLAGVTYAYTTTEVGGRTPPQALPATGSGPEQGSTRLTWLLWVGGLAGAGLVLVAGLLYGSRRLRG